MKKLYSLMFVLMLIVGALAGCGTEQKEQANKENKSGVENNTEQAAFPVTIKDALGKDVVIEQKPEKIVSLMPSNTEIVFALGLEDEIVGVSDFDNYPEEATKKEKIGGQEFNVEKVISLTPNLVLAHESTANTVKEGLKQLEDAGIAVLTVNDAQNFDQVYESILMIGKASGVDNKADELVKNMKDQLAALKEKAATIKDKKKVLVEVQSSPDIFTTGKNTFMDEMLSTINAENIANDQEGWIKMDQEAIIKRNPDVILTTDGYSVKNPVEHILSRNGWENVNAIQNKQVILIENDRVLRSGPRIVEGVEDLAKAIYPDVFK